MVLAAAMATMTTMPAPNPALATDAWVLSNMQHHAVVTYRATDRTVQVGIVDMDRECVILAPVQAAWSVHEDAADTKVRRRAVAEAFRSSDDRYVTRIVEHVKEHGQETHIPLQDLDAMRRLPRDVALPFVHFGRSTEKRKYFTWSPFVLRKRT